mgnify:CR=1 FL=1
MAELDQVTKQVLEQIDGSGFQQKGAFNLRYNGIALCHGDSEHVKIRKKEDKNGIDVYIDGTTRGEQVHIPVVVNASGMTDIVYNDFYIAEGADVTIVAQRPKLRPYIDAMRARLAQAMGVEDGRVSVKATTTEHLGFEGEELGISAHAVCLLETLSPEPR